MIRYEKMSPMAKKLGLEIQVRSVKFYYMIGLFIHIPPRVASNRNGSYAI